MHHHPTLRRILFIALACLAALSVAQGPAAAQDEPEDCSVAIGDYEGSAVITVDPVTVTPGGSVTLSGFGFPPNVLVPLFFNDDPIGSPVTDENGEFTFVYTVPVDTPAGTFEFSAACGTFILTSNITITPVIPPTSAPVPTTQAPQPLPTTGADSLPLVQIAAALIVIGGLVLFLARRQSERRHEGSIA